jgi:AcrR family transcriptional regulator
LSSDNDAVAADGAAHQARRYDSTLRRERAAQTRRRIVDAGVELLHGTDVRNWDVLSIRAVAKRAGVNERTVYRHFGNERGLHDAVMGGLEEQAGVVLEGMRLEDVTKVTTRIFEHVSSFPLGPDRVLDPTLSEASQRVHAALLEAVSASTTSDGWSTEDRTMVAGMLDVLWSVSAYERLVRDWQLTPERAIAAVNWVMQMVESAVAQGHAPSQRS